MDILIPQSWLTEHLKTNASVSEIAKALTLCGPSVERVEKTKEGDQVYHIEITTNRIDTVSVEGIAREARAILPRFNFKAELLVKKLKATKNISDGPVLKIITNKKLVNRIIGVVVGNVKNWETPDWMAQRLVNSGVRTLNAPVDITNYVMLEIGHPMHVFDYDKIKDGYIKVRESIKGEKILGLDNNEYILPGGDIVFENIDGEIIDLPGILGTRNSVVSSETKRFLYIIDNDDGARIRNTSMSLSLRTMAATLNEKGIDPELGMRAILRALDLVDEVCQGEQKSNVYDFYYNKPVTKAVKISTNYINKYLGIEVSQKEIVNILTSLDFTISEDGDLLTITPPSFRAKDVTIPEDIVEEIARIYGYHNIPNVLMTGEIPFSVANNNFKFENYLRNCLASMGGNEIYTSSLVPNSYTTISALKLKNPMGKDTECLRTSLKASLMDAISKNQLSKRIFLYEIANIYKNEGSSLPREILNLSGIFNLFSFEEAKGVVELILNKINIRFEFKLLDDNGYIPNGHLLVYSKKELMGQIGKLENDYIYFEFDVNKLYKLHSMATSITIPALYPPQIEDMTVVLPARTFVGEVMNTIKSEKYVSEVSFVTKYENAYTFRISYQSDKTTLNNNEVKEIRSKVIGKLKTSFEAQVK